MSDDRPGNDSPESSATPPADLESTSQLLERARAGDLDAVGRLIERHLGPLRRWARGRLPRWARDLKDTDDLVQDTLLQTFKRLDAFEPRGAGALQAYLRQCILNRVRDELRKKAKRPEVTGLPDLAIDGGPSPLEEAIGRQAAADYERALSRLKPRDREAIIGRIEMGYSFNELAEILSTPSAEAARKVAHRALVRLVSEMGRPRTTATARP